MASRRGQARRIARQALATAATGGRVVVFTSRKQGVHDEVQRLLRTAERRHLAYWSERERQ